MLTDYARFLKSGDLKGLLSDFNVDMVRDFVVSEQERGVSPYTVQGKVRALKAFSSWLFREGYIDENLFGDFKLPKVPTNLIEPLTDAEVDQLISYQNPLTAIGCRNVAILIFLLDTGIRLSELCCLRFEDTHVDEGYLKVMGKGSKERVIPMGTSTQKMLWRYVIHFRPESLDSDDNYLFLALDGKPQKTNAIKLLINRWGKKAGILRLHVHLCRHTFATNFLIYNCGDVFRLQQMLGHTSLEMVRRYVHFASAQALINSKTISPVDRMGIKKLRGNRIDQQLGKTGRYKGEDRNG